MKHMEIKFTENRFYHKEIYNIFCSDYFSIWERFKIFLLERLKITKNKKIVE